MESDEPVDKSESVDMLTRGRKVEIDETDKIKMLTSKGPSVIRCPLEGCSGTFSRQDHLRRHIIKVHKLDPSKVLASPKRDESKGLKCSFEGCNARVSTKPHLYRHTRLVHKVDPITGEKLDPVKLENLLRCGFKGCNVRMSRRDHLVRHIKNVHKIDPKKVANYLKQSTTQRNSRSGDAVKETDAETSCLKPEPQRDKECVRITEPSPDNQEDPQVVVEHAIKEELLNDEDVEEGALMCILCCYSYYPDNTMPDFKVTNNLQKFASEILQNQTSACFSNSFQNLYVCSSCIDLVNCTISRKGAVDEVEVCVRNLQLQVLKEMKRLLSRLTEYYAEMRKIENVISNSDKLSLEKFFCKNVLKERKQDNSLVLQLRDGIVSVAKELVNGKARLHAKLDVKGCGQTTYFKDDKVDDIRDVKADDRKQIYALRKPKTKTEGSTSKDEKDPRADESKDDDYDDYDDSYTNANSGDEDFMTNSTSESESEHFDSESEQEREDHRKNNPVDSIIASSKYSKALKPSKKRKKDEKLNVDGVDTSNWSPFKKKLLKTTQTLARRKKEAEKSKSQPNSESVIADPRLELPLVYNRERNEFSVGGINLIIHEHEEQLECSSCSYKTSDTKYSRVRRGAGALMQIHIQREHLSIFQCPICPSKLGSFRRYTEHIKSHQGEHTCEMCNKAFGSKEALARHNWRKHMTSDEIEEAIAKGCKDPRRRKQVDPLNPHKLYQCSTCGKGFTQSNNLKLHERIHTGIREICLCANCGNSFVSKESLVYHQLYSCPFLQTRVQCSQCPKYFKSKPILARHIKATHTSAAVEKPFRCDVCGKGFPAKGRLTRHMVSHSSERPYVCREGCGSTYKTSRHRARHEKTVHTSSSWMSRGKTNGTDSESDYEDDQSKQYLHCELNNTL